MNIDYQPLSMNVTEADIMRYKVQNNNRKFYFRLNRNHIIAIVVIAVIAAITVSIIFEFGFVYVLGVCIYAIPFTIAAIIIKKVQTYYWVYFIRLQTFVKVNGFSYNDLDYYPSYKGLIFDVGDGRRAYDILSCTKPKAFQIGNYSYYIGSGDDKTFFDYGYIVIQLQRNLPHMVLDSKQNDKIKNFGIRLSNLPVFFDKEQVLQLEGDFNDSFTLYAPKEYGRDALYIFSPDLMALFIDESGSFDAEIVDNELFIYSNKTFDLLNVELMKRLFKIIETVGSKTIHQTSGYADSKVGDKTADVVSSSGQRLKRRMSPIGVILISMFIILVLFMIYRSVLVLIESRIF